MSKAISPKAPPSAPEAAEKATITKGELADLERTVRNGLQGFMDVGQALIKIRESRGYLLRGQSTFEVYCEAEFGFSVRHGQRMIDAARTAATVKKIAGAAPRNEAVARELSPIADDEKAIQRVADKLDRMGKSISTATAEAVREVVEGLRGRAKASANGSGKAHQPAPKPQFPAGITAVCPHCGDEPSTYTKAEAGWECGSCFKPVLIGVLPAEPRACPHCGAVVAAADTNFCDECGQPLE